MANSREDTLYAPNSNDNPTSEVPNITMQGLVTLVRKIVQPLGQKSNAEPRNLTLPRFNPETAGADPAFFSFSFFFFLEETFISTPRPPG